MKFDSQSRRAQALAANLATAGIVGAMIGIVLLHSLHPAKPLNGGTTPAPPLAGLIQAI